MTDLLTRVITARHWGEAFKRDVCEGFDARAVAAALAKAGWLDCEGSRKTRTVRLPGMGSTRCHVLTGKMWEDGEGC
ncbi:MAG: hypothetical protein FWD67_12600 [Betaproteobacteria bacterium]|nr:hypothetical protein [Betaproteobacteria bacterium]